MRSRALFVAALATCAVAGGASAPPSTSAAPLDELLGLYAKYRGGAYQILTQTITTEKTFERLRSALDPAALNQWKLARHSTQAVFILDFALTGFNHKWQYWLDVFVSGRKFLVSRPEAPGVDPAADAFELRWYKAAFGLLFGNRRPDLLEEHGVSPLERRVRATPGAPGDPPALVDPWFALARGMMEEQHLLVSPMRTARAGMAIEQFDVAAAYESTRAEALVRKARLLHLLRQPADALRALESMPSTEDTAVRYWSLLFRGRAYDALERVDDAARAYTDALTIVPHAQSPAVALTVLEMRRGRDAEAYRWATAARRPEQDVEDPWWEYWAADFRLFRPRLIALRLEGR